MIRYNSGTGEINMKETLGYMLVRHGIELHSLNQAKGYSLGTY